MHCPLEKTVDNVRKNRLFGLTDTGVYFKISIKSHSAVVGFHVSLSKHQKSSKARANGPVNCGSTPAMTSLTPLMVGHYWTFMETLERGLKYF